LAIDLNEDLLDDIANELGISEPSLVEKDFHVTQILAVLSKFYSDDFKLIFAGGTCLSKTVRTLGRMSEDIDFKLIPLNKDSDLSQGQLRPKLSKVKKQISKLIGDSGYTAKIISSENDNQHIEWEIDYLPKLNPVDALRSIIQVETTYCKYFENHQIQKFGSMVAEVMQSDLEVDSFTCVQATHTVAEKLLSLLRRIAGITRGLKWQDDRLVRHVYDIHILSKGDLINRAQLVTILEDVMKWDADRFNLQNPEFSKDPIGECKIALDALKTMDIYSENYTNFLGPLVYAQDVETDFKVALTSVSDLFDYFVSHQTKF
jgi:hypothetical protein